VPLPFYGRRPAEPRRPGPTLTDVLRDRLGLELVSRPATEDVLVIDRIERPVLDP
jgi:uncharacterized protein (TIGR03435 family)